MFCDKCGHADCVLEQICVDLAVDNIETTLIRELKIASSSGDRRYVFCPALASFYKRIVCIFQCCEQLPGAERMSVVL